MNKELYVSSTPHETRLALAEDGEIAEIYFEREKEYSLAGAIFKGRVTRVLPGMQSAFVDIGLDRDAFLYVSDFFEDSEEYDRVVSEAENAVARLERPAAAGASVEVTVEGETRNSPQSGEAPSEFSAPAEGRGPTRSEDGAERFRRGRGRGRRGGRGGIPDSKFARPDSAEFGGERGEESRERPDEGRRESVGCDNAEAAPEAAHVPPEALTLVAAESGAPERPSQGPAEPLRTTPDLARPALAHQILPGETLAKYCRSEPPARALPTPPPAPPVAPVAIQEVVAVAATLPAVIANTPETAGEPAAPAPSLAARLMAMVLPGETLAKYRNRPTVSAAPSVAPSVATAAAAPPPSPASVREPPAVPASPAPPMVEIPPASTSPANDEEMGENDDTLAAEFSDGDHADAQLDADGAPSSDDAEPGADVEASAAVRGTSGSARMQAPSPRGGRSRHRRRRRGGERPPARNDESDAAAPGFGGDVAPPRLERLESRGEPRGEGRGEPRPPRAERSERAEGKNESGPSSRLIGDLLHEGQEILIQISKEPLGKKGARITSHLALPGRFLVYMPTVSHIGVSRKIGSDEERARLKRLILENSQDLPGGFIVRTAGAGASEEEFKADIRLLASQWTDMRQQFERVRSPALLHHDLNLVERILRDQLSEEFTHIWVDTDEQYERIVKFVSYFMPHLASRVRLYTRDEPLFEHFGIQEEINKALKSKVWLKSGGYIVLNQTEALVAIDVNTGKFVGRSNRLEDTIVKTNVDAIREIVRQIRLRDLGGIIVIDFIDMDERRNRQRVMQALEEAMQADRAPSKILSFNDFGLVALTRKRVKQSLERALGSPCPYCTGVGLIKSSTTVCNEIYSEVKKVAATIEREDLVLRVNPEIAKALKGQNAQRLRELEEVARKPISIRPDPQTHQEQFEIY